MSFFTVQDLSAGYGGRTILHDISFTLGSGMLLGVLGENGSGKTTLLKAICGILPHTGTCELDGAAFEGLSARRIARYASYIPQRSGISIDISVLDVVLMGFTPRLGLLEHPSAAMRAAARDMLETVGLGGREHENYLHLSEGQKQLCILARTLVTGGRLLLLDEPESALDFRYRHRMLEILRNWIAADRSGGIVTLHDPALALGCCDRLLLLHEGRMTGMLDPRRDPLPALEEKLSVLYGAVSLQRCTDRRGGQHLVMLKEREAWT